jgi:hypothetical protein
VILVVVPADRDSFALRNAVRTAMRAGVVVVSPAVGTQTGTVSYPTAQPGVIGVGGLSQAGAAVQTEHGDVALAAPAANLVSTAAGAGGRLGMRWGVSDPAYGAAFVAGTVALLRSYQPSLTPAQVLIRLEVTAGRSASGGADPYLGWGMLDAYAAVTSDLPADIRAPGRAAGGSPPTRRIAPAVARPQPARDTAPGLIALLGICVAALIAMVASAFRRGRSRRWQAGRVSGR